jgi:hypothetical protein
MRFCFESRGLHDQQFVCTDTGTPVADAYNLLYARLIGFLARIDDNKIVPQAVHLDKGSALFDDACESVRFPGIFFHETCSFFG